MLAVEVDLDLEQIMSGDQGGTVVVAEPTVIQPIQSQSLFEGDSGGEEKNAGVGVVEEDGWEFWARVYDNPALKQQMQEKAQNEPSIASLLQQDHLCQGELIVLNVPRMAYAQKAAVRQLIEKGVGGNVPMLDVNIAPKRWRLRFYRSADAQKVMQFLNGYIYRGRALMVHYSQSVAAMPPAEDGTTETSGEQATEQFEQPSSTVGSGMAVQQTGEMLVDVELTKGKQSIWTTVELKDMKTFGEDLYHYVTLHDGSQLHTVLGKLPYRKGIVATAIEVWPTAFLRLFQPKVNLVSRYLTISSNHTAYLLKKASLEGVTRTCEPWETMCPSEIRTDTQLLDYAIGFLTHFGPQHLEIDVPIRLLCTCLPAIWSASPHQLADKLIKLSPHLILFKDVVYLASNVRHRRLLIESLQMTAPSIQTLPKIFSIMTPPPYSPNIRPSHLSV